MMQKKYNLMISRCCLALIFICLLFPTTINAATKMPDFALESVFDGEVVKSEKFSGDVMLLTFFATWCAPCVLEVPNFVELQKDYAAKGFSVVAISVDQASNAEVAAFAKENGINYPVLMATNSVLQDFGGVYGIPTSFMVNRKGEVVKRYTGYVDSSVFVKDIKQML